MFNHLIFKLMKKVFVIALFAIIPLVAFLITSCEKDEPEVTYSITITISPENAGTVTGTGSFVAGTNVVLEATPNQGYLFARWFDSDGVVSEDAQFTFIMPAKNLNLTALFVEETVYLRDSISFQNLGLAAESYWNGSEGSGGFTIEKASFNNNYNADWGIWSGFAYSNITDIETAGWLNQYSAYTIGGSNPQNIYALAYVMGDDASITFSRSVNLKSMYVTNSTYAFLAMRDGDAYSKKFEAGDWFMLTINVYNSSNENIGSFNIYLADMRGDSSYIIDTWTNVDLSTLENVSKLVFYLSSSDIGEWGMNTPAYFCMDDFVYEYVD